MGAETTGSLLTSAHNAFASGDFGKARDLYEAALEEDPSAEALDGLGQALWFLCEIEEAIGRREEAYARFRRGGDACRAGEIALWLSVEQATSIGNDAAANGWYRRAERLLADASLCPAHAQLEVARGQVAMSAPEAARHFERAIEIGKELGDPASEMRGLAALGHLTVSMGDLEGGTSLLDEAMAAAMGGEVQDPWTVGSTCCSVLFACEEMSDLRRAALWSQAVIDFTQRRSYIPLSALCRSIYAGVMISMGEWQRAEEELKTALRVYRGVDRPLAAYPLARLAALRVRQGRIEEAEQLLIGWEGHPETRGTAVALLIARGDTALAGARLEEALSSLGDESPSVASLLPLLVEARLAEGDFESARTAADQLRDLAELFGKEHLVATADLAAGQVAAATGDEVAASRFGEARDRFLRLRMPFEEARSRLELARSVASRQAELAVAEAKAALETFERLGAAGFADEAASLLRSLGVTGRSAPRRPGELTKREQEVLGLLEAGLSNKEIGERLYITPKTASHHVSRILSKLGVRTRAEAAAYAARQSADKSDAK